MSLLQQISTLFPTRRSSDLLSFEEQVKLLSRARYVVSNHGAGLTNMLFMRDDTKVLELRHRSDYINNCYFILDRKSTRLNSSHLVISYAVFCLKTKKELWKK